MKKPVNKLKSPEQRKFERERRKNVLLSLSGLVLFFVLWEVLVDTGVISSRALCSPSELVGTLLTKLVSKNPDGATLIVNMLASLKLAVLGFLIAVAVGIPLGLFMGYFKAFDKFMTPIFEILRPIPPIAWIPIVILTLGIGLGAKIFIIFISAFCGCVINSYLGIKLTNRTYINVAKTFGASDWQIFTKVCLPSAVNMIFAGVRTALNSSWGTLVAAEMLAATSGLGYMIQMGRRLIRPDIIVLGMFTIGSIGALMGLVLGRIEKRIAPWRDR
ncbi:MAG: ABC transporter permease [Eubacteriales bacterium]|nr:ABC transporter permease [Eubacteriales bacterium]